ncbi:group 1 glycosyl transferase [Alloacidobacterium sp.]|uniref:group 1 glycosyl transferase n=1 Tax=Alloacidobacterium sp. TaxID=2951999 RepID=UPI002D5310F2|nr:group 1 glycosyl transferase [Alloacidobacterium sp.]HYK37958.1 group 1 glycosyl transferase [Alloacidobacterium sp.]
MKRVACTIISLNYLPYARTLYESFVAHHPDCPFFVLLVDTMPTDLSITQDNLHLITLSQLNLPDIEQISFKYDLLELNTNVKPSFLKYLLALGAEKVLYFDPDIYVYHEVGFIYELLEDYNIIFTPHCVSPTPDHDRSLEQAFLSLGVYNLGFVAVSAKPETIAFLDWWEERCLSLGYSEARTGLFVDQKWVNLAPVFFDKVLTLKHAGCNVAYWNLFERRLASDTTGWLVNKDIPLIFFHYSGVELSDGDNISSKSRTKLTFAERPDLKDLFSEYKKCVQHNTQDIKEYDYSFGKFTDGTPVSLLARRVYASLLNSGVRLERPFDAKGAFYKLARRKGLIGAKDSSHKYDSRNYNPADRKLTLLHMLFRITLHIAGNDRYTMLLKYLGYCAVLRNQAAILEATCSSAGASGVKKL